MGRRLLQASARAMMPTMVDEVRLLLELKSAWTNFAPTQSELNRCRNRRMNNRPLRLHCRSQPAHGPRHGSRATRDALVEAEEECAAARIGALGPPERARTRAGRQGTRHPGDAKRRISLISEILAHDAEVRELTLRGCASSNNCWRASARPAVARAYGAG